jgi:predicted N-formylglutamate amidohydrolase
LKGIKATEAEQGLQRSVEAFDAGAGDLASSLSERLECMGILANFSKLIIDPALPIIN